MHVGPRDGFHTKKNSIFFLVKVIESCVFSPNIFLLEKKPQEEEEEERKKVVLARSPEIDDSPETN